MLQEAVPTRHNGVSKSIILTSERKNKEENMEQDYIIAPEYICHRLEAAEMASVVTSGLLEDVISPIFDDYTCEGLLDAWSKETDGDKGAAALNWMTKHFDALCAACEAVNVLSSQVTDILQMLRFVPETEAAQNG